MRESAPRGLVLRAITAAEGVERAGEDVDAAVEPPAHGIEVSQVEIDVPLTALRGDPHVHGGVPVRLRVLDGSIPARGPRRSRCDGAIVTPSIERSRSGKRSPWSIPLQVGIPMLETLPSGVARRPAIGRWYQCAACWNAMTVIDAAPTAVIHAAIEVFGAVRLMVFKPLRLTRV